MGYGSNKDGGKGRRTKTVKDGQIIINHEDDDPANWFGRETNRSSFGNNPCYEKHPVLEFGNGKLYGGNCKKHRHITDPIDLYVALDSGMEHPFFDEALKPGEGPISLYYPIQNMSVPNNADKFKALIDYIISFLVKGKSVHVGCIGGHGRTGLVIAAIYAKMGNANAIQYTRHVYCKRAVESKAQEGFLATHFGATLPPAKTTVDKREKGF